MQNYSELCALKENEIGILMMKQSDGNENGNGHIISVSLTDVDNSLADVNYQDDELVLIDNLRDIPDFTACKIAFNVGLVCLRGKLQFEIGENSVTINSRQALFSHSHVLLTNIMASPDIQCRLVALSDRVLKNILQSQITIWNKAMYPNHFYILNLSDEHISLFDTLLPAFGRADTMLKHEIFVSLLRAGFLLVCDLFSTHEPQNSNYNGASRMNTLFHQFLHNISQRQKKKARVSEYADELCLTPKYLTTICRKMSGKSAMAWISEYVTEDIIYYLKHTDLSAKEIAHRLGFENVSFFGKFAKAHLGVSPQEYRKRLVQSNA